MRTLTFAIVAALAVWCDAKVTRAEKAVNDQVSTVSGVDSVESEIQSALAQGNAKAAAQRIIHLVKLRSKKDLSAAYALHNEYFNWSQRGKTSTSTLFLEVALLLANESLNQSTRREERGVALNDIGNTLSELGERESGDDRFEAALAAYGAAIKERSRERFPFEWAMTQDNIANVRSILGKRQGGSKQFEESIAIYRSILEVRTRTGNPGDWARTHNNLGVALKNLGQKEAGTEHLQEAIDSFRLALEVRTVTRDPRGWGMTKRNLGNALLELGKRENSKERLEEALAAYGSTLLVSKRQLVPLDWAATQINIGNALQAIGERENGTERLNEATKAYNAALEVLGSGQASLLWAQTLQNSALAEATLFERTKNPSYLVAIEEKLMKANELYTQANATYYLESIAKSFKRLKELQRK